MSLRYGFFNSVNGDRKYNAEDMTKYFDKIVSDGVFHDPDNALQVTPLESMTIQVQAGRGLIACRWLENDDAYNLTIDPSDVVLDRADRVVMRLNLNEDARNMELDIIKGTPYTHGSEPILPALSSDPLITELTLATIVISANTASIGASDITDTRADAGMCGWVRSLIAGTSGGGTLKKYQSHQTIGTLTDTIYPNIPQYLPGEVMQVYLGGVLLVEDVEYTISGSGSSAVITTVDTIRAGNQVTCILLVNE